MRLLAAALLTLLVIGLFVTIGLTGILDTIVTGWTSITTPGGTQ